MICIKELFFDDKGRGIERLAEVDKINGMATGPTVKFFGLVNLSPGPQRPPINLRFDINAESIGEAFMKFDYSADQAVKKLKEQASKPKIVTAGAVPSRIPVPGDNGNELRVHRP